MFPSAGLPENPRPCGPTLQRTPPRWCSRSPRRGMTLASHLKDRHVLRRPLNTFRVFLQRLTARDLDGPPDRGAGAICTREGGRIIRMFGFSTSFHLCSSAGSSRKSSGSRPAKSRRGAMPADRRGRRSRSCAVIGRAGVSAESRRGWVGGHGERDSTRRTSSLRFRPGSRNTGVTRPTRSAANRS